MMLEKEKKYDEDVKVFSNEIIIQYINKIKKL